MMDIEDSSFIYLFIKKTKKKCSGRDETSFSTNSTYSDNAKES